MSQVSPLLFLLKFWDFSSQTVSEMISHFSRMQSVTSSLSQGSKAYIMHEAPWRSELWIHNCTLGLKWKVPHLEATRSFPKYLFAVLISIINIRIKTFFFLIFWFQQGGQDLITTGEKRQMPLVLLHSKAPVMFWGRQDQGEKGSVRGWTKGLHLDMVILIARSGLTNVLVPSYWWEQREETQATGTIHMATQSGWLLSSLFVLTLLLFCLSKPIT